MYGCGLHWRGFVVELCCLTAKSYLCIWCSSLKTHQLIGQMLSTKISGFCEILIVSLTEENAQVSNIRASILVLSHKALREEQVYSPNASVP